MTEREVVIKNRAGIHARPATLLVNTANKFSSQIFLEKDSERVNAKSIMGIITLGAGYNTKLRIIADGEDEEEAVKALAELFDKKFEEE
ncbi:HPr family phosphocarrier protein [Spirochaeta thermophila]|uniref:Phosphotransferase system, phosphocarrier protein HPr n=2 Tax=Winmispira thermophila TaxID=154 RepID=G0GG22_WINT7|nr:HPr family phosphocarrier protein [Spirochaeta thermophila]ADN03125.1 phosphocarrier protein HPr [Spirochaeta thermophila DSM 6192]AEJ62498.1 Phosphotransferase system, phosphocarrier protein HPr [Spirochaeta thermophila DSM 6578]